MTPAALPDQHGPASGSLDQSIESLEREIKRCDREIQEILDRQDVRDGTAPWWLVTLGLMDWEYEKGLFQQQILQSAIDNPRE